MYQCFTGECCIEVVLISFEFDSLKEHNKRNLKTDFAKKEINHILFLQRFKVFLIDNFHNREN